MSYQVNLDHLCFEIDTDDDWMSDLYYQVHYTDDGDELELPLRTEFKIECDLQHACISWALDRNLDVEFGLYANYTDQVNQCVKATFKHASEAVLFKLNWA
jgi:hypothetical protein